jgi:beta-phosphoglucomutase
VGHEVVRYTAIIFDLDGVICHTDHYHYLAWKQMADGLGVHFDETINNRLRGVSRMESLDIILERHEGPPLSAERRAELAAAKNDAYRELLAEMSPADLADSVRSTLEELRAKGYRMAIGSSSRNARFILERIGLGGWFDEISDGNNISRSKPDPEVFLEAAGYLGVPAGECVVIEDAVAGVEAAHAAGMVAVSMGDAAEQGAGDHRIGEFAELVGVMAALNG